MITYFKKEVFKSRNYLKWVRSQPSCISSKPADDAHHIKCPGCGGSTKCSDLWTIPLTREEHQEFHRIGWVSWETKYKVDQRELAMQTVEKAIEQGILQDCA